MNGRVGNDAGKRIQATCLTSCPDDFRLLSGPPPLFGWMGVKAATCGARGGTTGSGAEVALSLRRGRR